MMTNIYIGKKTYPQSKLYKSNSWLAESVLKCRHVDWFAFALYLWNEPTIEVTTDGKNRFRLETIPCIFYNYALLFFAKQET